MLWDMRYVPPSFLVSPLADVWRGGGRAVARLPIQTLQEARDSITSISIPPSAVGGAEIVTGCVDGVVRSYDVRMGKLVSDTIGGKSPSCFISGWMADTVNSSRNERRCLPHKSEGLGPRRELGLVRPADGPHERTGVFLPSFGEQVLTHCAGVDAGDLQE